MRTQGIYLRDVRHGRREGGTDGSSRADEVAVLVRLVYELLRDDVHDGVAVADDRVQLRLETVGHDLRQLRSIDAVRGLVTDLTQRLVGVLDDRRTLIRADRTYPVAHVGDHVRIIDDDFLRLFRLEVAELVEHLLRRTEVELRVALLLVEATAGLDDPPIDVIVLVDIMAVAGRADRLSKLGSDVDDLQVIIDQVLRTVRGVLVTRDHEAVVSERLHLQIIVEGGDVHELLLIRAAGHRLEHFTGDAGAADDETLPQLPEQGLRDTRTRFKVL